MKKSVGAIVINNIILTIQMVIGVASLIMGAVGLVVVFTESFESVDIAMIVFFGGVGLLFIIAGTKRLMLLNKFNQYATILSRSVNGSISKLALTTKTSEDNVIKDLQKMINKKYFVNAYIDLNARRIVFPDQAQAVPNPSLEQAAAKERTPVMVAIRCKACGGVNQVEKGTAAKCEYCDSPLG